MYWLTYYVLLYYLQESGPTALGVGGPFIPYLHTWYSYKGGRYLGFLEATTSDLQ